MISTRVTVTGHQDIVARLAAQKHRFMRNTEKAVYDQLGRVAALSTELVPVDTGMLRESIRVTVAKTGPDFVRGEVSYNTDYATKVHESHPTKAKFLETAWNVELGAMTAFIVRARGAGGVGGFGFSDSFSTPKAVR